MDKKKKKKGMNKKKKNIATSNKMDETMVIKNISDYEESKTKKYQIDPVNGDVKTNKTKKKKVKKEPSKRRKIIKRVILTILLLIVLGILILGGIIAGIFFSDKYKVTREDLKIENVNSKALDSEGNLIATIHGDENRKLVKIEDMPEYLPKMFVALEDERFYEHNGIDIKRTLAATVQFLLRRGESDYGGSTITQQLIKNTFEDKDDTGVAGIERKIREMSRAYNTEKVLSKTEILEMYLNKIFMGGTYYGVETASEYYFNKNVKDLSLAEAAYLVAINTSPNAYEPFSDSQEEKDRIKDKVKVVLAKFKSEASKLEYDLTEEAYNQAVEEVNNGLKFEKGEVTTTQNAYSYLTAAAIEEVVEDFAKKYNLKPEEAALRIRNNGYTIYTTQVSSIQHIMEEEFLDDNYIFEGRETNEDGSLLNEGHTQAAMVIIDFTNGQVVGCMGGLGEDSDATGFNRATMSTKQPGSSIKPIGVVAPALENEVIMASSVYDDSATVFRGGYNPHNSDGYSGLLTVRHAIEVSSNIVNIKIISELGPEKSAEFLREMNFDKLSDDDIGLSLALGATSATPLQMAAAYAMIDNNGEYIEPTFYTKVVDINGETVLEPEQDRKRMMSEQNAYILKEILTAPVTGNGGTATTCWISGMEVGAKTGSTDEYKDRWLCGITPYYAGACWFGFDNQETPYGASGNKAARIWGNVMRAVHEPLDSARFERPSGVVGITICKDSGCVATESCERTEVEYFTSGNTPRQCEGHQKLKICKETGKIANQYCKDVEEKTYLVKPAKENTNAWSTNAGDKYDVPKDTCDKHKAPEKVKMVSVVDKKVADAKKQIEALGLKVEVKYEETTKVDEGIVLAQDVKAGTELEKGKTVKITVSKKVSSKENTTTNTTKENTTTTNENTTTNNAKANAVN